MPCYDSLRNDLDEKKPMQSISGIIYLILIACLLPYVFTIIAKKTAGFRAKDNQHPREFLSKTTGLAAHANAAQQNSFESLPLFIAAILMAGIYGDSASGHHDVWYCLSCLSSSVWYLLFGQLVDASIDRLAVVTALSYLFIIVGYSTDDGLSAKHTYFHPVDV